MARLSPQRLAQLIHQAGFRGQAARTVFGIAGRESRFDPRAYNQNASTGDLSYGLTQINMIGDLGPSRLKQFGLRSAAQLYDPLTNLKAAYTLSRGGTDFGPWGIGKNAYRSGAGYDTIAQYASQYPGAPQGPTPAAVTAPGPVARASVSGQAAADTGFGKGQMLAALLARSRARRGAATSPLLMQALSRSLQQAVTPTPTVAAAVSARPDADVSPAGTGPYPFGFVQGYKPLGQPGQGTHSRSERGFLWQDDNAWDYGAPAGTPVRVPAGLSGTVSSVRQGATQGRFGGTKVYLDTPRGQFFLTHLGNVVVKPGQQIGPGDLIGEIGAIPGLTPHLHAAWERYGQ